MKRLLIAGLLALVPLVAFAQVRTQHGGTYSDTNTGLDNSFLIGTANGDFDEDAPSGTCDGTNFLVFDDTQADGARLSCVAGGGFDSTTVNDTTWGDDTEAIITWTWDQLTGTDPTLSFDDNLIETPNQVRVDNGTAGVPAIVIEGHATQSGNMIQVFDSDAATQLWHVTAGGGMTVNDNSEDADTRIEGNGDPDLFFVDAGNDAVVIGSQTNMSAKFAVDGDADEVQLRIEGNATQNQQHLLIENSAGNDLFEVDNLGGFNANDNQEAATSIIRGDTDGTLFLVDGVNDRVGVSTATPDAKFEVEGDGTAGEMVAQITASASMTASIPVLDVDNSGGTTLFAVLPDGDIDFNTAALETNFDECVMLEASAITCSGTGGCADPADVDGTNFSYKTSAFDSTTDEDGTWTFSVPQNFAGTTATVRFQWMSNNAACSSGADDDVCWTIDSGSFIDNDAFNTGALNGTLASVSDRCLANGDIMTTADVTFTHSIAADTGGSRAVIQVARDVDGTAGAGCNAAGDDDYAADAELLGVEFCYNVDNIFSGE